LLKSAVPTGFARSYSPDSVRLKYSVEEELVANVVPVTDSPALDRL
jgi:hypothetical protein